MSTNQGGVLPFTAPPARGPAAAPHRAEGPPPTPDRVAGQGSYAALTDNQKMGVNALLVFQEAIESPFDKLSAKDKAFVEAAKAFTSIVGAGILAICIFGAGMAYTSKRDFRANSTDNSTTNSSSTSSPQSSSTSLTPMQEFMVVATVLFFIFTSCANAIANGTVHYTDWLMGLKVMIHLEIWLVSAMCGLYIYLLTADHDAGFLVILFTPCIALIISGSIWRLFGRRNLR